MPGSPGPTTIVRTDSSERSCSRCRCQRPPEGRSGAEYAACRGYVCHTAGRVVVAFVITPTGKVASSIVYENTIDWELANCVAWVMKSLSFPPTPRKGKILVIYPFNFQIRPYKRPYGTFEPH
jgi:hypothetical protein